MRLDHGYVPKKINKTVGAVIAGTHKARYRVQQADYPKINREYVYIQCNCSHGLDHDAMWAFGVNNPPYEEIIEELYDN